MSLNKTRINWGIPDFYTWNPISGCKRKCKYCYAERLHARFYKTPFSDIVFRTKFLNDLKKLKGGETVFVGSMSDIEYWNWEHTQEILKYCSMACGTTFMFLSKNPSSYEGFNWPKNTMQGLTLTCEQDFYKQGTTIDKMRRLQRPFLSIEPLLGNICGSYKNHFERIIVGAMTGPGAIKPKLEWIQAIKDNVPKDKIFWKSNIKKYL